MTTGKKRAWSGGRLVRFGALATVVVLSSSAEDADAATAPPLFNIPSGDLKESASECWQLQGQAADAGLVDPSSGPGEKALDTGICLYHLLRGGEDRQGLLDAVGALQSAQKWGVDRARQATANLMEGLASCRVAALELKPNLPSDQAQTPLFCLARRNALSSFSRLQLQELRIAYSEETPHTSDELLSAMTDCYRATSGPLNQKFAAGCGVYRGLDAADVSEVARAAYSKVETNYFTGAAAPITAMFTRKKEMAEYGLSEAEKSITALQSDSTRIGSAYNSENGLYRQVEGPLSSLVQRYQETYATAAGVIRLFRAWNHGLFEDKSNGTNLTGTLDERTRKIKELAAAVDNSTQIISKAVDELKNRGKVDAALQKNAQAMCRVFFCELAVKQGPPVSSASSYTRVCNRMVSPLCKNQGATLPEEFCKAAKFPDNYRQYNLARATANICWTEAP